jgi:hypothetical protein
MSRSLKYKLWRRRMSISSPRMAVRSRSSWPMRLATMAIAFALGAAAALWFWNPVHVIGPNGQDVGKKLSDYQEQLEKLTEERDQFSTTANASESQINMERAAQKQLAAQVKTLEQENTKLKEDLAFFDSLLPNATGPLGINIRRLKVDLVAPNQLRYRLLIMQGGKGDQVFTGNLQLAVTVLQGGKSAMINFPDGNPSELDKFKLSFKYYQRVEGVLTLPEGTTVRLVQARVLEKGQMRAQQSANL